MTHRMSIYDMSGWYNQDRAIHAGFFDEGFATSHNLKRSLGYIPIVGMYTGTKNIINAQSQKQLAFLQIT